MLAQIGELVLRLRPAIIVYYCGTNDILFGKPAAAAAQGFAAFAEIVQKKLPDARIVYLGINTTPLHAYLGNEAKIREANTLVRALCTQSERLTFVDPDSDPRLGSESMYLLDNHHLNDDGHVILAHLLKPTLAKLVELS